MNPLDLLRHAKEFFDKLDLIRKDEDLTKDLLQFFSIVKSAGTETAKEFKKEKDIKKGFESTTEVLDALSHYLKKGSLPLTFKFSLPVKIKGLAENSRALGQILRDEKHPVTQKFTERVTQAEGFDDVLARLHEKANEKMIRFTPTPSGGAEISELFSGQCIARLNAQQWDRLNKTILARIPPKTGGEPPKPA